MRAVRVRGGDHGDRGADTGHELAELLIEHAASVGKFIMLNYARQSATALVLCQHLWQNSPCWIPGELTEGVSRDDCRHPGPAQGGLGAPPVAQPDAAGA